MRLAVIDRAVVVKLVERFELAAVATTALGTSGLVPALATIAVNEMLLDNSGVAVALIPVIVGVAETVNYGRTLTRPVDAYGFLTRVTCGGRRFAPRQTIPAITVATMLAANPWVTVAALALQVPVTQTAMLD